MLSPKTKLCPYTTLSNSHLLGHLTALASDSSFSSCGGTCARFAFEYLPEFETLVRRYNFQLAFGSSRARKNVDLPAVASICPSGLRQL